MYLFSELIQDLTKATGIFHKVDKSIAEYHTEAAVGIARLTTFYRLDIDRLVDGYILDSKGTPLNVRIVKPLT